MKKTVLFAVLVVCLVFTFACKSQPTAKSAGDQLKDAYDRYRAGLILDGAEKYTVKEGDTLSAIARAKYPNAFYFPLIQMASSNVISDPDVIEIGDVLTIPNLDKNLNDAKAKDNIKKFLMEVSKIEDGRGRPADAQGLKDLSNSL